MDIHTASSIKSVKNSRALSLWKTHLCYHKSMMSRKTFLSVYSECHIMVSLLMALRKGWKNWLKITLRLKLELFTLHVKSVVFFRLKSRTPSTLLSNVVYKFTCAAIAHITYIGYTSRHLLTRVKEHTDLSKSSKSHVREHILLCDGCKSADVGFNNFSVLKKFTTETDCKYGEAFSIKKEKPLINKQLFANGASLILNIWN